MYLDEMPEGDGAIAKDSWQEYVLLPHFMTYEWWLIISLLSMALTTMIETVMMRLYMYAVKDADLVPESVGFYEGDFDSITKTKLRMLRKRSETEEEIKDKKPSLNNNGDSTTTKNTQTKVVNASAQEKEQVEKTDLASDKPSIHAKKRSKQSTKSIGSLKSAMSAKNEKTKSMKSVLKSLQQSKRDKQNKAETEGLAQNEIIALKSFSARARTDREQAKSLKKLLEKTEKAKKAAAMIELIDAVLPETYTAQDSTIIQASTHSAAQPPLPAVQAVPPADKPAAASDRAPASTYL
ncbi:hypothetical protein QR680_011711 [Steinernema hermaphroditum]|uniref:Uncharacterized protein n=1 Tax=Steinernema hermaphroditum TaxID=289476 RepID=A0AA39HZG6_9BILA|nr:hypothetical protein QR680_011711 [Steinernema hermaphroditum]